MKDSEISVNVARIRENIDADSFCRYIIWTTRDFKVPPRNT